MERRMRGNSHVRCGAGERPEITSKAYLSLFFANPPILVAEAFSTITQKYRSCFDTIEYGIYHRPNEEYNYLAFKKMIDENEKV